LVEKPTVELTWQLLLKLEMKKTAVAILQVQQQQQLIPSLLQPLHTAVPHIRT